MPDRNPGALSLAELHGALRAGDLSAGDLADWAIANHEATGESLGAYRTWDPDALAAQARAADAAFAAGLDFGAVQGVPVSVKDIFGVAGYPIHAGCPVELPETWRAEGPVVQALRSGLATVTGKTNTVQFAFGGVGTNPHSGTPKNPWDGKAHRAPGGSSAGAGVSLITGTAILAVGSDTAGSVRVPASVTGTVGVKTTAGRWSTDGIVPLSPSLDTPGILARTVEDAAVAFALIDPMTPEVPLAFLEGLRSVEAGEIRIGLAEWLFDGASDEIADATRAAVAELERAGAEAGEADWPEFDIADGLFRKGGLAAPEFATFINNEMADFKGTLDPNVAGRFTAMEAITAVEYLTRRNALDDLAHALDDRFAEFDVLVGPTVAITPPDIATLGDPKVYARDNIAMLRNTAPINLLSLCAVTIPVALDGAGMPVGLQIIAPHGEDERALAAALAFETVLGTSRKRLGKPPLGHG